MSSSSFHCDMICLLVILFGIPLMISMMTGHYKSGGERQDDWLELWHPWRQPSTTIQSYRPLQVHRHIQNPNLRPEHRDIKVIVGVKDQDLALLASSEAAVKTWFCVNIEPYLTQVNISVITVGNGIFTTPDLAAIHNGNFVKHIVSGRGTPKRPNTGIQGFLFATFNENLKPPGTEQNFGLYNPTDMKPIYKLF